MITLDTLTLPDDLIWRDEYQWSPVGRTASLSLTGALILEEAAQLKGRPITLAGGESHAWISKAELETLRAWADTTGKVMTLTLHDSRSFQVMFERDGGAPLTAQQIIEYSDPGDDTWYQLQLRFIEV